MNMEGLNRFVLAVIVCLALALYVAVVADGMTDFAARLSRKRRGKQKPRNRRFRKRTGARMLDPGASWGQGGPERTHDPDTSK